MTKWLMLLIFIVAINLNNFVLAQENSQQFEEFNLQGYTEGGEKAWDVKGDTADVLGSKIKIYNVDANRYSDQEVNLKARTGIIDKESGNIFLEEDVVITSKEGIQLKTDSLDWQKEDDLVKTEDRVVLTNEGMTATGTGLKAQPGLKTAQMNREVTVQVNTEPKKEKGKVLTITCDGPLEIDQSKSMAVFNENVVAVQDDRTLKADKMEIYFDEKEKRIVKAICIGNVVIIQGENEALAERAIYTVVDQKVVLLGRPKLIMITEGEGGFGSFTK